MCSTRLLPSQQRRPVATEQQLHSRFKAGSKLTAKKGHDYFGWVKTFLSLKQILGWIQINLRLINSTMILYRNSLAFIRIHPWFHNILHYTKFTDKFITWIHNLVNYFIFMKPAWIHKQIHTFELFWLIISLYSSLSWIHIWIYILDSYEISWSWICLLHCMTYGFIYEFMYMKNIVKSYLKSWLPKFHM